METLEMEMKLSGNGNGNTGNGNGNGNEPKWKLEMKMETTWKLVNTLKCRNYSAYGFPSRSTLSSPGYTH